jgi:hypothetical protein
LFGMTLCCMMESKQILIHEFVMASCSGSCNSPHSWQG